MSQGDRSEGPIGAAPVSALFGHLPDEVDLVGRDGEVALLRGHLAAVGEGQGGRLILISGDPGVGKTRLAREIGRLGSRCGFLFLSGHYLRDGGAVYGPWIEALEPILEAADPAEGAHLVGPYAAELAQVMPAIAQAWGPLPPLPRLPRDDLRRRLYDGFAGLIANASRRRPIVLLIDDLHWAPGLTLLLHVARQLKGSRALVIATARSQEFWDRADLTRQWVELNRTRVLTRIDLRPLTEAETALLLVHFLSPPAAARLTPAMYRTTRGNPFFIEEVLRSLIETGALRAEAAGWSVVDPARMTLPTSVTLTVRERVTRLGEPAGAVLAQAAVLGRHFDFRALHLMTGLAEEELVDTLDRALLARLIVDSSVLGEERYAFLDDQVQEILYAAIPAARRSRYHLRAGRALEAVHGRRSEAHLDDLARHFVAANETADAIAYCELAGAKCESLFHWQRAGHYFEQAVGLRAGLPDTPDNRRRRVDAIIRLVGATIFARDPALNLEQLHLAEGLLRGLAAGEDPDDDLRQARLGFLIGRIHYVRDEHHLAIPCFERVVDSSPRTETDDLRLMCLNNIGRALGVQGYFDRACAILCRVVDPLERRGLWREWIFANGMLGLALADRGDCAAGLDCGRRALARSRALNDLGGIATSSLYLSQIHFAAGDFRAMLEVSQTAIEMGERSGDSIYVCQGHGRRAWAESRLGLHEAAAASFAEAENVARTIGGQLAWDHWFAAAKAELAWNAGNGEEAVALAERAVAQAERVGGVYAAGLAHRTWAQALVTGERGRWDLAEEHLAESARLFEAGPARLEAARTHRVWGQLLRDRRRLEEARGHLRRAAAQFEESGLAAELDRTRRLLADRPPRSRHPRRDAPAAEERPRDATCPGEGIPLTDREVEVLRLVAAGHTNRQIAEQLVISLPTVERHITNLYGKIGVHGRAAATAFAVHRGLA